MASAAQSSLFPLAAPITTREIARRVKDGGVAALTEARLRADEARYQEIHCRSALNPVKGMPFGWTLNPYRGCTHGCHYCFARRYHTQFEMDGGDEFASVILVKANLPDVLRRELDRPAWKRELVALGTATDPYQPIEGHYKLTRQALQLLAESRTPVSVVTKGPMALRDRDLFVELGRRARCTVCFSVPTVDDEGWRLLEPGTAPPLQRLRAMRALVEAGVHAGVLMAPIVPGMTSSRAKLEATVKAAADHGARFVGTSVLYLEGGTREHFLRFLQSVYPNLADRYGRLYRGKYASKRYTTELHALTSLLRERYGVIRRERPDPPPNEDASDVEDPHQNVFAFQDA
ncbi:MAG TPA: radical SAM protein [Vicinamibacterales bacterium]|jgi:DNA repair photolyase